MKKSLFVFSFVLLLAACNQTPSTNSGEKADIEGAVSAEFKPASIKEQIVYQRAIEALVWGMPAVNYDLMLQAMAAPKGNKMRSYFGQNP